MGSMIEATARALVKAAQKNDDIKALLEQLGRDIDAADEDSEEATAYRNAAQEKAVDGEIEVDEEAVVSMGDDDGAYVQAWMWVSNTDAGLPSIHDDEE